MSDGSLSQEEIDALLQGADDLGAAIEPEETPASERSEEKAQFLSLCTEAAQAMGTTLSTITGKTANISNPRLEVLTRDDYITQISGKLVQVSANYNEGILGDHSYVITEDAAKQVAALMMAQEEDEGALTEMALSALTEGFSQMSGAYTNVLEERIGKQVKTEVPKAEIRESSAEIVTPDGHFMRVRYDFASNGNSSFIDEIVDMEVVEVVSQEAGQSEVNIQPEGEDLQSDIFQAGLQQSVPSFNLGAEASVGAGNVGVQPVQFAPLSQGPQQEVTGNIGLLMDVSMQLTVELGRTKMLIKDILGMGEGTIVELDKLAGEPVDLLVNGKLIAKGEVVVIDENFGVRVTDIISPMERISNLE